MKRFYFDMDGTLAEWRPAKSLGYLFVPGYFESLAPQEHVVRLAKQLVCTGHSVCILSAVLGPQQESEKRAWLQREFGDLLSEIHVVFVPCGANKSKYVVVDRDAVLLDDHSPNLWQWYHAGGVEIKAINNINGSGKSWRGSRVDALSPIPVTAFLALTALTAAKPINASMNVPKTVMLEAHKK